MFALPVVIIVVIVVVVVINVAVVDIVIFVYEWLFLRIGTTACARLLLVTLWIPFETVSFKKIEGDFQFWFEYFRECMFFCVWVCLSVSVYRCVCVCDCLSLCLSAILSLYKSGIFSFQTLWNSTCLDNFPRECESEYVYKGFCRWIILYWNGNPFFFLLILLYLCARRCVWCYFYGFTATIIFFILLVMISEDSVN